MPDDDPPSPTPLYPRHMGKELHDALASARVVSVIGPRQVGKTTLVRSSIGGGRFVTLDNQLALDALSADPIGQLELLRSGLEGPLIIDEVQRLKSLALEIKMIVDENRRYGQFLLTGSSNVFTLLDATDSLAGRVLTLKLWPLSLAEIERRGPSRLLDWSMSETIDPKAFPEAPAWKRDRYTDLMLRGGYPDIRALPARAAHSAVSRLRGFHRRPRCLRRSEASQERRAQAPDRSPGGRAHPSS